MLPEQSVIAGVDVSKCWLDVSFKGKDSRHPNTPRGILSLKELLKKSTLVVCEASGGYEQLLAESGLPVAVVSASRVRSLAKAQGLLSKTDKIDAKLLVSYGTTVMPPVTPLSAYKELRRQLDLLKALQDNALRVRQLEEHQAFPELGSLKQVIADDLCKTEEKIKALLEDNPSAERLLSVPGVGFKLAAHLIARLPELGRVSAEEVAALVGVAPFVRESGQLQGRRFIAGGRGEIRRILYMAIVACLRCNPYIKAHYARLRAKGKAAKVAMVACMRKLIIILNTMEKEKRSWRSSAVPQT